MTSNVYKRCRRPTRCPTSVTSRPHHHLVQLRSEPPSDERHPDDSWFADATKKRVDRKNSIRDSYLPNRFFRVANLTYEITTIGNFHHEPKETMTKHECEYQSPIYAWIFCLSRSFRVTASAANLEIPSRSFSTAMASSLKSKRNRASSLM